MDKNIQIEKNLTLISVIVPVYQVEKRIERCINSLIAQSFSDFEVILVDDGSKDSSGKLCDRIAETDNRFVVIHKENGGVASAKQKGLDVAQGEYIIFVDSDDWVERTMLDELYCHITDNNADMVICDYVEHRKDRVLYVEQNPHTTDTSEVLANLFSGNIHGSNCNKLVKRELIVNNHIAFPHYPIMNEDTYFNTAILMQPLTLSYLNKAFYHYDRTNENSVTRAGNPKAGIYAYQSCEAFRDLLINTQEYWNLFVAEEMPWMAYLCLYYGSVSRDDYQRAFYELSTQELQGDGKIAKLALKHYNLARLFIMLRKTGAIIRNK